MYYLPSNIYVLQFYSPFSFQRPKKGKRKEIVKYKKWQIVIHNSILSMKINQIVLVIFFILDFRKKIFGHIIKK